MFMLNVRENEMAFVDEANLAGVAPGQGADMVGFAQLDSNAAARTASDKLRETVSVLDFGGVPNSHVDSTTVFENAIASLGAHGGTIEIPAGNWWINLKINRSNIKLRGQGGVGEESGGNKWPCIRPYATGAGTATLRISDQTRENRRIKLENLVISGDNGAGNQADKALWIDGGTYNLVTRDVDLQDGLHTLHIEPGGGQSIAGMMLKDLCIRNDLKDPDARAIYVRRYDDPHPGVVYAPGDPYGYTTQIHIAAKVNLWPDGLGRWLEVDGTGSTGLVVHFHQTYVDDGPKRGILMHGLEVIECFGGLQLDPGAEAAIVVKRMDMVSDPSRFLRGFIEGVGGQLIELADNSRLAFPEEPGLIAYQPRLQRPFLGDVGYFSTLADPYDKSIYYDFQTAVGPMRWNGCPHRWTDASDASDGSGTSGAMQTLGGISAAKNILSGGFVGALHGLKVNGLQVIAARQATVTLASASTMDKDVEARAAIADLIARLQAHGLIA